MNDAHAWRPEWLACEALDRAHSLAAPFYCSSDVLALERRAVFGRHWQLVGAADAVAGRGDHAVTELGTTPVIVLRDDEGALRAFHNVCRHRGGPLAWCDGRGARALHCKYHGWTYGLAGRLRHAPEMSAATEFDAAAIALPQAAAGIWGPLLFAALPPDPIPLESVFEGVGTAAAGLALARRVSYELPCNWKVYVDNFLEGYHLPHIHPGLNAVLDYRRYRIELGRWHSLQQSPLDGNDGPYSTGTACYYFVYPNTMLNLLPGRLQTNRVVPLDVARCRVDFDYYYPAATSASAQASQEQDQAFSDAVQAEDAAICAAVQKGLASGSYEPGRLSPAREAGVKHFHDLLRADYRAALEGA